jgi:hypothetical protein
MAEQPDLFEPRMPEVDQPKDIRRVFDQARTSAAAEHAPGKDHSRQVVLVTPGRMLMLQPCPPPGTMPQNMVSQIERLVSPKVKRKIAVIAYTELQAITKGLSQAIPFFGMLVGMAYIGHSVWIFEGHATALATGCKEADVLIVDSGMVPHLTAEWRTLAASEAPKIQIYVHDRTNHSLRKVN